MYSVYKYILKGKSDAIVTVYYNMLKTNVCKKLFSYGLKRFIYQLLVLVGAHSSNGRSSYYPSL